MSSSSSSANNTATGAAQLKQAQASMGTTSAPTFARRSKFLWPLLITVNLAGAYIFTRTKKKGVMEEEAELTLSEALTVAASVSENPLLGVSIDRFGRVKIYPVGENPVHPWVSVDWFGRVKINRYVIFAHKYGPQSPAK